MSRFSNPRTAQAMMETHGHTNIGMPPKPGFPGAAAPVRPGTRPIGVVKPQVGPFGGFSGDPKPIPNFIPPGTRPRVTTGGPKPGVAIGPQNINPARPVPTAQTAKHVTPPPTVMPQGVNPNFRPALANAPKYTGPGAGPTGPINTAKVNEINNMLQGKPMPTPAPTKPNPMGGMFGRMAAKPMKKGGTVSSASKRADGIAVKGKTRGRIV